MAPRSEISIFEERINITLLNDIVAFVFDATDATYARKQELIHKCLFLTFDTSKDALQKKYGFLYLGELLERYEERFGLSDADFRAIALAVGYTKSIVPNEMFVGNQLNDFVRKLRRRAEDDLYLTGALYLLSEGQSGATVLSDKLYEAQYDRTEELIFAMSLFCDDEQVFLHFKQPLLHLLGTGRNMPVLGNTRILNWLITRVQPVVKTIRTKDVALFRALCALPSSFVKEDGKHYAVLVEHGYSPLEIAYANMLCVLHQSADGVLGLQSVVTQKIAVAMFRAVLGSSEPFSPEIYEQLSELYVRYEQFTVRCYGQEKLEDTLKDGLQVKCPETFIWFSRFVSIHHPAFNGFDIMDPRWDALAAGLDDAKYMELFEMQLEKEDDKERILQLIGSYDMLTDNDYVSAYWDKNDGSLLKFLVKHGIIDLWQAFCDSIAADGSINNPQMLKRIRSELYGMSTIQTFQFYRSFLPQYGFVGLEQYFNLEGFRGVTFTDGLLTNGSYNGRTELGLTLEKSFLNDDEHRLLLSWLEEYIFTCEPEKYIPLVVAILENEFASGLLPHDKLRALFGTVICLPDISYGTASRLKARYYTPAEREAEEKRNEVARLEKERQDGLAQVQHVREEYTKKVNGSITSVAEYLDGYKYSHDERQIACRIVHENLDSILLARNYELDRHSASQLFSICAKLIKAQAMTISEAQNHISKIKEASTNGVRDLDAECTE